MLFDRSNKQEMVSEVDAVAGSDTAVTVPDKHYVFGTQLTPPWPEGLELVTLGMGCFWGAERIFWSIEGVFSTAVGYGQGFTKNPSYEQVCTAKTGHNEVALVVFDPDVVSLESLLAAFWENHDPTQWMGQGNDIGTQYRSGLYYRDGEQKAVMEASKMSYQSQLDAEGYGTITTEIEPVGAYYYAEEYHQQYLAKNPGGYCNHGFCQVAYNL